MQWLLSLVAMIKEVEPRLVVPCDEVAIRLLFELVRNPPRDLHGEDGTRIKVLVQQSLGNPDYYETSIDKTLLPAAAEALGVPVPRYAVVQSVEQAAAAGRAACGDARLAVADAHRTRCRGGARVRPVPRGVAARSTKSLAARASGRHAVGRSGAPRCDARAAARAMSSHRSPVSGAPPRASRLGGRIRRARGTAADQRGACGR